MWSALPKKAIDKAVKDYCKRLQICVLANGRYIEYFMCNNSFNKY